MNHLHYTAKHHHLQYSMTQLKVICSYYYRHYAPKELTQRRNVHYCKVNDDAILVLLVLQAELGIKSQRRFYQLCQVFLVTTGLERTRFYRRARYLIPLLKRIHQGMTSQFHQDDIVIMDSFPYRFVAQLATIRFAFLGFKRRFPIILQKRCGFMALRPIC